MNELKHLYNQNPNAKVINLDNRNIKDSDVNLFNELVKFRNLEEVSFFYKLVNFSDVFTNLPLNRSTITGSLIEYPQ